MWTLHFVAVHLPPLEEVSQDRGCVLQRGGELRG